MNAPWVAISAVPVAQSRPCGGDVPPVPHGPSTAPRRLRAVVIAVGVTALVTGCGSSHHRGADGPTTTAPVATTSTLSADQAAVLAAWRHYWDIYIAVGGQMQLPDPRLAQVATGQELRTLGGAFLAAQSEGEVLRGTVDLDPKVVSVGANSATLRDCYLSNVLGYKNNQPVGPADARRRLVSVSFVNESGTWKVSAIDHLSDGCAAP